MDNLSEQKPGPRPDVSVVIPAYNRQAILQRCLQALIQQTHRNFEVIVVDDQSSDRTSTFLEDFSVQHPGLKLRWLRNERQLGANASRNRAIAAAQGAFIAFLDSDCVAHPDWLERLMDGFCDPRVAAVTGRVTTPPPENIYELCFKGTNRVHDAGDASRLVAGNMCVRRDLMLQFPLEEDLKYGCDEEGIFLRLRTAGFKQRVVPEAIVCHEHPFNRRSFFRQARVGGAAAAWFVYKYYRPPRPDLLPFLLAYLTLPLAFVRMGLAAIPAAFFLAALAAITYNDLFRKNKTLYETARTFPVLILYYHLRLIGYVTKAITLRLSRHHVNRIRLTKQ